MTPPQSLSERLRDCPSLLSWQNTARLLCKEAADVIDQQAAEIDLMKEGRRLHDELADHQDAEIAKLKVDLTAMTKLALSYDNDNDEYRALIAQAAAALSTLVAHAALHEEYTSHPTDEDVVQISLGELHRARQAFAAICARETP